MTPTNNPLAALLRSRKFWMAVFALVVTVATTYYQVPERIILALNGMFAVVIGGIAFEDANKSQ